MRVPKLTQRHQLVLVCHGCGSKHPGAERYCSRCGRALFEPAVASGDNKPSGLAEPAGQAPNRRNRMRALPVGISLIALAGLVVALDRRPAPVQLAGLEIGDSSAKVERILGKPALPPAPMEWKAGHSVVMWHYDPDLHAEGVPNLTVTFIDGRVRRVAALDRRYPTADGLRVGDTLTKARSLYGTAIEEDPAGDLVPFKFLRAGEVIKVIVEQGDPTVLAIGIETPDNITLTSPGSSRPRPTDPGLGDQGPSGGNEGLPYLGSDGTAL